MKNVAILGADMDKNVVCNLDIEWRRRLSS
jgi:hypothetical protein